MPSYLLNFTTSGGPQSARFTFDEDSPLVTQVPQVVEELRLRGLIIQGAPDDELAVYSNGNEVDLNSSPRALGLVTTRPVELRMRPRPIQSHYILADSYFPRAAYAGILLGMSAAAVAWCTGLMLYDISRIDVEYSALDLALALAFGGCVGAAMHGFRAYRQFKPFAGQALLGMGVGALGAGLGAAAAVSLRELAGPVPEFATLFALRLGCWILVFAGTGIALALLVARNAGLIGVVSALTLLAGVLGAVISNFPGPTALWQGIGLLLGGGAIGFGLVGFPLRRVRALIEVEAVRRRLVGVLAARSVPLTGEEQTRLAEIGPRGRLLDAAAFAWFDGARIVVQPVDDAGGGSRRAGARVGGAVLDRPVLLGDGEAIDIGETRWRLHVLGGGSA